MSNLYHVTVTANNGSHQEDAIAATMDVAVKRALAKSYRTSKSLRIEAELSNHGPYDKVQWLLFNQEAKVVIGIRRRDGTFLRAPQYLCRANIIESAASLARQFIDMCDDFAVVVCLSRGATVARVTREDSRLSDEQVRIINKRITDRHY